MEDSAQADFVTAAAKRLMGIDYLFPYQRLVVANLLEAAGAAGIGGSGTDEDGGREDAGTMGRQIVILPTGAGKSLCFQLPALMMDRPTLVAYPILSLMADQERRLRERGFEPVVLRGGQSEAERERVWNRLKSGDAKFAIANPEVLLSPKVMDRLAEARFAHLVVDEAHCVCEWGESFRPSYLEIGSIVRASGAPLVTAFTATASPPVLDKIDSYVFGEEKAHRIVGDPDRQNIAYAAVGALLKDRAAADYAFRRRRPAIVFCGSRARTERLSRMLRTERPDIDVRFYHAGLEREEKAAAERWFFSSRDGILVATCAYGMGVDKSDVRTVIHRDCPPSVEAYLQESGRAGRDGKEAEAILLWGPEDFRVPPMVRDAGDRARREALLDYARNIGSCRRERLLGMLGAELAHCSGCDVCAGNSSAEEREKGSVLSFIRRNRRRYDLGEAAEAYAAGIGHPWTEDDARRAMSSLLRDGSIRRCGGPLWQGTLTAASPRGLRFSLPLLRSRVPAPEPVSSSPALPASADADASGAC